MTLQNEEANIVIEINKDSCWIIRGSLRPSMFWRDVQDGVPEARQLMDLREQANSAILRFNDEPGLKAVTFYLTEIQAWALDTVLPYDGDGGSSSETLIKLFRGLWGRSMGKHYNQIVQDPNDVWEKEKEEKKSDPMAGLFGQMFTIGPPPPSPKKPEEPTDETKE